jgi:hypothetical protein
VNEMKALTDRCQINALKIVARGADKEDRPVA